LQVRLTRASKYSNNILANVILSKGETNDQITLIDKIEDILFQSF